MSVINANSLLNSVADWQLASQKANTSMQSTGLSNILNTLQPSGADNFSSILESLKDPSKSNAYRSISLEGSAEYNLKASFKTETGQNVNLELNVKFNFKFEQAAAAYEKNKKPQPATDDYFSPENTAKRITDFAMGFLSAFQSNHTDQTAESSTGDFFTMAKDAISKGFDQAKDMLGELYGETGQKTYDLVMKYLDEAKNNLLGANKASTTAESISKITA